MSEEGLPLKESLLPGDALRMTFSVYACIVNEKGEVLLWYSPKDEKEQKDKLTPIGGRTTVDNDRKYELHTRYGATRFGGAHGSDLRYVIPITDSLQPIADQVREFTRETGELHDEDHYSPHQLSLKRELEEELARERLILSPEDLRGARMQHLGYGYDATRKPGEGFYTLKVMDVVQVVPTPGTAQRLDYIAAQPTSPIKFATPEEIAQGRVPRLDYLVQRHGILPGRDSAPRHMKINKAAQYLINPQPNLSQININGHVQRI